MKFSNNQYDQDNNNNDNVLDDSKQTEEIDMSKSDFTETHSQETMRNLQRISDIQMLNQSECLELRGKQGSLEKMIMGGNQKQSQGKNAQYYNLPDEEDSQSSSRIQIEDIDMRNTHSKANMKNINNQQRLADLINDQGKSPHMNVLTQDEEEKTHDFIKSSEYDDDYHDKTGYQQNQMGQSQKRSHTDTNEHTFPTGTNGFEGIYKKNQKQKMNTVVSLKQQLPSQKFNLPLSVTVNEIFEIFSSISKNQRYQIIEMEQNLATAVNKEPFSLKRMFLRCIPFSDGNKDVQNEQFISAIRIQISVNEAKCCRKIHLKGLYGDVLKLQEFTNAFKSKMNEIAEYHQQDSRVISNRSHLSTTKSYSSTNLNFANLKNHKQTKGRKGGHILNDEDSDQEEHSSAYNETSAIYQIHKILSSEQYTLGKNVSQYIECFHMQYKSIKESSMLLPSPLEGMIDIINDTVNNFQSQYNLGKDSTKSLMYHCRPAVEKYIFQKLYDKLFAMYACKNEREDRLFVERSQQIKKMKPYDIMVYLGIKDKFMLGDNMASITSRISNLNYDQSKYLSQNTQLLSPFRGDTTHNLKDSEAGIYESNRSELQSIAPSQIDSNFMYNNGSTSSSLGLGQYNKQEIPYQEAIKCIEKIQQFQTPREKLQCLQESFQSMKTAIVDHYKGKLELSAMDDVLPLTIYTVAMADLTHIQSELNLMEDFLSVYDKGFDHEKRLLTNLDVSIRYVNHEWQI